jgi:hypothetical protein
MLDHIHWGQVAIVTALNLSFFLGGLVIGWLIRHRHADR